uniref:Gag-Pol polyprotein n=1 Tax=Tanacetum cinerariifolium TaxID=118510 RepID=A0A699GRS2_TANCI|nr:Gag-Pol polyprotein [Tanacetum cinerariifolium]
MALKLMAKAFQLNNTTPTNINQRSSSNPCYSQIAQSRHLVGENAVQNQSTQNDMNKNGLSVVSEIANQHGNEDVVTAPAKGNGNGINGNPIRCYNYRGECHYASNRTVKPRKQDAAYLQQQLQIAQKEEEWIQSTQKEFDFMAAAGACEETERANANCTLKNNLQQASTSGTQSDKAPVYDSDGSAEEKSIVSSLQKEKKRLKSDFKIREDELLNKQIQLENKIKELDNILVKTGQTIQTMNRLSPKPDSFYHTEQKMALGYQNPFYLKQAQQKQQSLYNGKVLLEKHDPPEADESRAKHKALEFKIERLLRAVGTSANTKFAKQSILGNPPFSSRPKLYDVAPLPKSTSFTKVGETHALSKPVISNSVPTPTESEVVKYDNVISPEIFSNNPFKASRVDNFVPKKHVKASIRTKLINISQPYVITKNNVNSKTNDFSPKDVKSTTRTRRPLPRNNTKNDKAPSNSKSSRLSNNLEKIEENLRNLQFSSNQKHMSSECNYIKLAIRNAKSEVVCAMCKQCLITGNHDVCVLSYVNDMNSRALNKKKKANFSKIANQTKHKA